MVCCGPKRLGIDFPRWQFALTVRCPSEDSAFTHAASFHNDCFEQFVDKRERATSECEIMGLILLSLHKRTKPTLLSNQGMRETDRGWLKRKKGQRASIAEYRKRKKEEGERLNGGERERSSSYWIISDCQWLKGWLLHGATEIPPNLLSFWGGQSPNTPHLFNLSLCA